MEFQGYGYVEEQPVVQIDRKFRELLSAIALLKMVNLGYFGKTSESIIQQINRSVEVLSSLIETTKEDVQELAQKEKALLELKDEFLSNVNHELKTPLTTILGTSEFLLDSLDELSKEDIQSRIQRIQRAGKNLLELVNEILMFSHLQVGQIPVHLLSFSLNSFLINLVEEYREISYHKNLQILLVQSSEKLYKDSKKELYTRVDNLENKKQAKEKKEEQEETAEDSEALEEIILFHDPSHLKKIIGNLINNAVKFTQEGKIQVHFQKNPQGVIVSIKDTGPGIEKKDLKRIFGRFAQGKIQNNKAPGTGLGLHIVQTLTQLHGGTIQVQSQHGMGSQFTLSLPLNSSYQETTSDSQEKIIEEETIKP